MAINNSNPQTIAAQPIGTSSLVFGGTALNGGFTYNSSIPAGTYLLYMNSVDSNSVYSVVTNNGATFNSVSVPATGYVGTLRFTTTESSFTVSQHAVWATTGTIPDSWGINEVTYGNNTFVVAGNNGYLSTSTDLITWTSRNSGFNGQPIYGLTYGNNLFVAVGPFGQISTSTDAITWTTRNSGRSGTDFYTVHYGNGIYVASGSGGGLSTSTDGITWTSRNSPYIATASNIYCSEYGASIHAIGTTGGELATSTDGITWTTRTSSFGTTGIYGIKYGNNLWVAVGNNSAIRTSTKAITWTTRTIPGGTNIGIYTAEYANGIYLVGGYENTTGQGFIHTSTDGITWTTRAKYANDAVQDIVYGKGVYLAAGQNGIIRPSSVTTIVSLYNTNGSTL